jgi:hypothetical protein
MAVVVDLDLGRCSGRGLEERFVLDRGRFRGWLGH